MAVVGYKNDPDLLKNNFTSVPITVGGGGPIAYIDGATRRGHNVVKYYYYFSFFFSIFPFLFFLSFLSFLSFLLFIFFISFIFVFSIFYL